MDNNFFTDFRKHMYLHNDDNYKLDFDEENGTLLPSMIYLGIYLNFFLMIFLDEIS